MTSRITETPLKIYTDGACSGNPGPAGVGAILFDSKEVYELSEFLGMGTNNIAELTAVLRVLERVGKTSRQGQYLYARPDAGRAGVLRP